MTTLEQCFVVNPTSPHTHTIILLHGRGSIGEDFAKELFECEIVDPINPIISITLQRRFPTCRWMFPSASPRFSTVFQEEITEWFDIVSLTDPSEQEELQKPGLVKSLELIVRLIREEGEHLDPSKLILGGISQGFSTAALAMIGMNIRCAGFIGLSGWLPFAQEIERAATGVHQNDMPAEAARRATIAVQDLLGPESKADTNQSNTSDWSKTPIFLGHEQGDPVVDIDHGRVAKRVLDACGSEPEWHEYPSDQHWIQEPDELNDIVLFLDKCIS